ncbi:MAG: dihydroorotase [Gammaproteobacteria bacterium]|jgi:dihydroorotase
MDKITLTLPDDWHVHLRDGDALNVTVPATARCFGRAIVMPNLPNPVDDIAKANTYKQHILQALPKDFAFTPLMTLYLTENLSIDSINHAKENGIYGVKLYPRGATTGSGHGIVDINKAYPLFAAMEKCGLNLLVHGEVVDPSVDVFDREAVFIDTILEPIIKQFPNLKIVVEHISTAKAVDFVLAHSKNIAATITAHHLLLTRNDLLVGGLHPHHYCLPVIKTKQDQEALIKAATSGNPKFFLGTDSAPHPKGKKESACCAAGIFTAHAAIELYAEVFDKANALDKLEAFASFYGADFYGLPRHQNKITLQKSSWQVPESIPYQHTQLVPFRAGEHIDWKLTCFPT